jgi:trimeric autotransporter adhesin
MALVLADRVQETTTTSGTGSITLLGAVPGFQSFAVIGNSNTCYYTIYDSQDVSKGWEVGIGTYSTTGPTLARTTVLSNYLGTTANINLSGNTATVFVTYPSEKSVNLNASGNVSALGTVSSGTWQGSTIGVAYGGTGVTSSSGADSVVLRDSNQNIAVNRINQSNTTTTAAGGTTALTVASSYIHTLIGTGGQTYTLPDATTLATGVAFLFNNLATGVLTIQDYATATIGTIPAGGAAAVFLTNNSTVGGTWDLHAYLPEGVTFGTNAFNLGTAVISGGTWQGGTIQSGYGGTGLTTFTGANNALYSTSSSALTAGTLPVVAGGSGATTLTGYLKGNGTSAFTAVSTVPAGDISGTLGVPNGGTGQTSFTAGRVLYGNGTGALSSSANMTFSGTNLTLANDLSVSTITVGKGLNNSLANNVVVGYLGLASTTTGDYNTGVGSSVLNATTTGQYNTAAGGGSLASNTTGSDNTAIGAGALASNINGIGNTALGYLALSTNDIYNNNIGIGYQAGAGVQGYKNILIGVNAGFGLAGDNNVIIGGYDATSYPIFTSGSNQVVFSDGDGNVREWFDLYANEYLMGNYRTNATNFGYSITIPAGQNTMSIGPVTIDDGETVELEDGANWVIV